jgi:hypothetical protein
MLTSMKRAILHNLDPAAFAEDVLGFKCDEWQKDVIRFQGPRLLMLIGRQCGKTTAASIKALHTALFYPNSLTLIVSPSIRQSSEMFRNITKMMQMLDDPPKKLEDNRLSCTLSNDSRIISLPSNPDTVRGFAAPTLVLIDEAARCTDSLYYAVRPMLATGGGQLILLSTPNGKQGFFWDSWQSTIEDWLKVKVLATECPRISPEFLQEERETLGQMFFDQEYMCEFVEGINSVFSYTDIINCFRDDLEPLILNFEEDD